MIVHLYVKYTGKNIERFCAWIDDWQAFLSGKSGRPGHYTTKSLNATRHGVPNLLPVAQFSEAVGFLFAYIKGKQVVSSCSQGMIILHTDFQTISMTF